MFKNIGGKNRTFANLFLQPVEVIFFYKLKKRFIGFLFLHGNNLVHCRIFGTAQFDFPVDKFFINVYPFVISETVVNRIPICENCI